MSIIFALLIMLAISLVFYYFFGRPVVSDQLQETKGINIKGFKNQSIGKIVGKAEEYQKALIAPFSGKKCVYYQISVEKHYPDHKGVFYWKHFFEEHKAVDFILKDETDSALIKIDGFQGELIQDLEVMNIVDSEKNPAQYEKIKKYVKEQGLETKYEVLFFQNVDKRIRIKEGVVHLGETVAIKGFGERISLEDSQEEKLVLSNTEDCTLLISDKASTLE